MKLFLILYCIFIWCIFASRSFRFGLKNKIDLKTNLTHKPRTNNSKYVYMTESSIYTETDTINSYENERRRTQSLTTERNPNVCSASAVGTSTRRRKKRFIHYINSFSTPATVTDTSDFSILSDAFLNCTTAHTTVEPECFHMLPNGSVHVPMYNNRVFDKTNYVIREGQLYVCPNFFDLLEEKFSSNIGTISIVGISISTVCIILYMIMFFLVEKLRNIHGYCLFSLCISLLITYVTSFVQVKISDHAECKVIGLTMMYSLLASFFWMNAISFDIWHAIRLATSKLRLTSNQSILTRLGLYSCYAWGMPVLFIVIAVVVDSLTEDERYQLTFRKTTCWFQSRTALLLYFALPVFVLIASNIVFFAISFLMISRSRSDSGSQDAHSLRSRLFMSLRLGSVMGLVWIFGLIATVTQREWLYYLHSACTALQGVFIFFSFTLSKTTQKACKRAMSRKKSSKVSAQSVFSQSAN